jgi:hypothetical protein
MVGLMVKRSKSLADRGDTIDYIKTMLAQLRRLSESEGYPMLSFFIDMAYEEAGMRVGDRNRSLNIEPRDSAT